MRNMSNSPSLREILLAVFQRYLGKPVDEHRDAMKKEAVDALIANEPGFSGDRRPLEDMVEASIDKVFGKKKANLN